MARLTIPDPTRRTRTLNLGTGLGRTLTPASTFGGRDMTIVNQPDIPDISGAIAAEGRAMSSVFENVANLARDYKDHADRLRASEAKERAEQARNEYQLALIEIDKEIDERRVADAGFTPDEQNDFREQRKSEARAAIGAQFQEGSDAFTLFNDAADNIDVHDYARWNKTIAGRRADVALNGFLTQREQFVDIAAGAGEQGDLMTAMDAVGSALDLLATKGRIRIATSPEAYERLKEQTANEILTAYVTSAGRTDPVSMNQSVVENADKLIEFLGEDRYQQLASKTEAIVEAFEKDQYSAQNRERTQLLRWQDGNFDDLRLGHRGIRSKDDVAAELGLDPRNYDAVDRQMVHDAWEQGLINDDQRLAFQEIFDRSDRDLQETVDYLAIYKNAVENEIAFIPSVTDEKKAAEVGFEYQKGLLEELTGLPFEAHLASNIPTYVENFRKTAYVPKGFVHSVSRMISSKDDATTVAGLASLASMYNEVPELVANNFNDNVVDAAIHYRNGGTLAESVALADGTHSVDPDTRRVRAGEFKDIVEDVDRDLASLVNNRYNWRGGLAGAFTSDAPDIPEPMRIAYRDLAQYHYERTGSREDATELAMRDVSRRWGRTTIGGVDRFMYLAPEQVLAQKGAGPATQDQMARFSRLLDVEFQEFIAPIATEGNRYRIVPDARTATELRTLHPSYLVMEISEEGLISPVLDNNNRPLRFAPTGAKYHEDKAQGVADFRAQSATAAEQKRQDFRVMREMQQRGLAPGAM